MNIKTCISICSMILENCLKIMVFKKKTREKKWRVIIASTICIYNLYSVYVLQGLQTTSIVFLRRWRLHNINENERIHQYVLFLKSFSNSPNSLACQIREFNICNAYSCRRRVSVRFQYFLGNRISFRTEGRSFFLHLKKGSLKKQRRLALSAPWSLLHRYPTLAILY